MRVILAGAGTVALVVAASVSPGAARATWSPARSFDAAGHQGARIAVNGRGDAVVVWTGRAPARLRVTLLPAGGRPSTRTLATAPEGDIRVVLDRRGGATAAWHDDGALFAAHGSLTGRWSAPQRIVAAGTSGAELAVSPDRRVLLAWTNVTGLGPGSTGVAWRRPGRPFSGAATLRRPAPGLMPGEAPQSDNGAIFDGRGRAYLWGTCDGVVRTAEPGSRRLALVQATPGRTLGFSFSVTGTGTGRGLASWIDSRCATDPAAGSAPGPVRMRPIRDGAFGPPVTLGAGVADPASFLGSGTTAIALAGDGSLVTAWASSSPTPVVMAVDGAGRPGAVTPASGGRLPYAADAGGNVLWTAPYVGFVARPRGGVEEPFDHGGPDHAGMGATAAAAPHDRGFGLVWDPDLRTGPDQRATSPAKRLSVSFWTP